jgi:hypothetical protein
MLVGYQQFGDLDSLTRSTPNRIVPEHDQTQIQDRAGAQPADCHCHAASTIYVEPRLGTIHPDIQLNRRCR